MVRPRLLFFVQKIKPPVKFKDIELLESEIVFGAEIWLTPIATYGSTTL
tara:strand:+ start:340 stop:486 length:147 start_codon:yes stop_codon:yes gene_type:complete